MLFDRVGYVTDKCIIIFTSPFTWVIQRKKKARTLIRLGGLPLADSQDTL